MLKSQLCKQAALESTAFRVWAARLGEQPGVLHRKIWEYAFICEALSERGMLQPGNTAADLTPDVAPYGLPHLRVNIQGFGCTSIGLIITKGK